MLVHDQARNRAIEAVKQAQDGVSVTLAPPTRSKDQNARYWSKGVLAQIAEHANVLGRKFEPEVWHEQFKKWFIGLKELPDGSVVGESSTGLSKKEFCAFSDQVEAYAVTTLGITFVDLPPHGGK